MPSPAPPPTARSPAALSEAAEGYLPELLFGKPGSLAQLLGANGVVEDPHAGRVAGAEAMALFEQDLQHCVDAWFPRLEHLRTTVTHRRVCSEDILRLDIDGETVELPVGTVVSRDDSGASFVVRVYYTLRPFSCPHVARGSLFAGSERWSYREADSDVVTEFLERIASGDLNRALACLEADIYLREAGGQRHALLGTSAVRDYLARVFLRGAPGLRPEIITDDGRCAAIEFSVTGCTGQSRDYQESDPCLVVFERSEDRLIRAVRLYADMAPASM